VAIASTNGSGNLSDSVLAIYGPEVTKGLIPLKEPSSIAGTGMSLRGYISPPNQARPSSRYMTTLINRRVVKTKLLVQAINKACSAFFPKGKYPVLILDLRIPPDMIDVNVHPQKTEIRFKDEHWIFGLIWETVKTSLSGLKMIADIEPTIEKKESQSDFSQIQSSGIFSAMTPKLVNIPSLTGTIPSNNFDADRAYVVGEEKLVSDIAPETVKNNAKNPLSPVMQLSKPKILAQLKNTYLLGEDDEGLFIIDQHVAHERVLFDQYLQTYKDTPITTQTLLFPVPLKLLPSERLIIRDHLDDMKSLGFSIYQEEDGQFYITAIPVSDKKSDQKNIQDMLSQVLNGWESRTLDVKLKLNFLSLWLVKQQ
jgi:DNA mismatch repair protein MutL